MTTVLEMVKQHLEAHGYDGLYSPHADCACERDNLAPCEEIGNDCEAGYRVEGCHEDCGEGCMFHIMPEKPAPLQEKPDDTG